jgi:hypothetical protein
LAFNVWPFALIIQAGKWSYNADDSVSPLVRTEFHFGGLRRLAGAAGVTARLGHGFVLPTYVSAVIF